MYKTVFNVYDVDHKLARYSFEYLLWDIKDDLTLARIGHLIHQYFPGTYKVIGWEYPDVTSIDKTFSVILEFDTKEEFMQWALTWS